jgi:hypothetical protein
MSRPNPPTELPHDGPVIADAAGVHPTNLPMMLSVRDAAGNPTTMASAERSRDDDERYRGSVASCDSR